MICWRSYLYKLKPDCQWHMRPVSSCFTGTVLHYKTVYGHFRKWPRNGEWKNVWSIILECYKSSLDMSSMDLDGSHITPLRGRECCGYQERKKRKTTNTIHITDHQRIPITMPSQASGSHNDLYDISEILRELSSWLYPIIY